MSIHKNSYELAAAPGAKNLIRYCLLAPSIENADVPKITVYELHDVPASLANTAVRAHNKLRLSAAPRTHCNQQITCRQAADRLTKMSIRETGLVMVEV